MSGPLSTFRTPSRPLFEDKEIPNPAFKGRTDGGEDTPGNETPEFITVQVPVMHPTKTKRLATPVMTHSQVVLDRKGRQKYTTIAVAAQRHVLDYSPQRYVPGKHAAGRAKPLKGFEEWWRKTQRRAEQARKSATEDAKVVRG